MGMHEYEQGQNFCNTQKQKMEHGTILQEQIPKKVPLFNLWEYTNGENVGEKEATV